MQAFFSQPRGRLSTKFAMIEYFLLLVVFLKTCDLFRPQICNHSHFSQMHSYCLTQFSLHFPIFFQHTSDKMSRGVAMSLHPSRSIADVIVVLAVLNKKVGGNAVTLDFITRHPRFVQSVFKFEA